MAFVVIFVSFDFSPYLEAKIYKWVDEEGAVHFCDTPSKDGAAEEASEASVVEIETTNTDISGEQTTEHLTTKAQPRQGMERPPNNNTDPRFSSPEEIWERREREKNQKNNFLWMIPLKKTNENGKNFPLLIQLFFSENKVF